MLTKQASNKIIQNVPVSFKDGLIPGKLYDKCSTCAQRPYYILN